jgi:hypothetical protein
MTKLPVASASVLLSTARKRYVPDIWYYQGALGNEVAFMDIVLHNPMRDSYVQSISTLQDY